MDCHRYPAVAVIEQNDATGRASDAADPAHQAQPIGRSPAIDDTVPLADIQQYGLPKRRTAVGQDDAGDIGELWVKPDVVQIKQLGVLLFQLQCGLFPGFHLLQFATQFLVLFIDAGVRLEVFDHVGNFGQRNQRPFETGHDTVDDLGAQAFDAGAVNAP